MPKDNLRDSLPREPKGEQFWVEYAVTCVEQTALRISKENDVPANKIYRAVIDYFNELLNEGNEDKKNKKD